MPDSEEEDDYAEPEDEDYQQDEFDEVQDGVEVEHQLNVEGNKVMG